jgi:hypothetical protein
MNVSIPVHVMMVLMGQLPQNDRWMKQAAREYCHREIKKLFPEAGPWVSKGKNNEDR